jgi:hypothetical protein
LITLSDNLKTFFETKSTLNDIDEQTKLYHNFNTISNNPYNNEQVMFDFRIEYIKKIMKNMKSSDCTGYDGLSYNMVYKGGD